MAVRRKISVEGKGGEGRVCFCCPGNRCREGTGKYG